MDKALRSADNHFAFGKNWADYARTITQVEIDEAKKGIQNLIDSIDGQSFLDIGCGSGLHALAALQLGAADVFATDIDNDSVLTTKAVLSRFAPDKSWKAEKISVFDLEPAIHGSFDIVYSWGVLHHTGNMQEAVRKAAAMCKAGGSFAFALYRRTRLDWFWHIEKNWYAHASKDAQNIAAKIYIGMVRLNCMRTKQSFSKLVKLYKSKRGMSFYHDVHDWLGGWPYESTTPDEVENMMKQLGFEPMRIITHYNGKTVGLAQSIFGSGCDEYVYRKKA